jgi:hypothetical protein
LTPDTKKLLLSKIDELSSMGCILKDEETLDYITAFEGDDTDVSSVMSEWGSVDICYLALPPVGKSLPFNRFYRCLPKKELLLTKMRWSVAEMRYATSKGSRLKPLVAKVFRTQS